MFKLSELDFVGGGGVILFEYNFVVYSVKVDFVCVVCFFFVDEIMIFKVVMFYLEG